jgi:hypothetical protein
MRHVDYADALSLQVQDYVEELFDFAERQYCGWFVKDENLRFPRQRLADLLIPWIATHKTETKIHCAIGRTNKTEPLRKLAQGEFKSWQEHQNQKNFKREYILSLVYHRPNEWFFGGAFRSLGSEKQGKAYMYRTELLPDGSEFIGRAIFSFVKEFRASYLLAEKYVDTIELKEVLRDAYTTRAFPGFELTRVSYEELSHIVAVAEPTWKAALSSVSGVYVITDLSTGKLYVGSAAGQDQIWSRWSTYATTPHGGNKILKQLIEEKGPEYAQNFQYSILEVRTYQTTSEETILQREAYWKEVLATRLHGYNAN